jgi:polyvinyl alcohol dehydrogenase (cytochrome)
MRKPASLLQLVSFVLLPLITCAQATIIKTPAGDGQAVYAKYCASCHDKPEEIKSPAYQALREMSARIIAYALTHGKMRVQGEAMTAAEIDAVVEYLAAAKQVDNSWIANHACSADRRAAETRLPAIVNGFGLGPRNHRRMSAAEAGLAKSDMADLELDWAMVFPQTATLRAQPVIIGHTLYQVVPDTGQLFALNIADQPCVHWVYEHIVPLRTSPHAGSLRDGRTALVFGDVAAHVQALDAATGQLIWRTSVRISSVSNTTGMPVIYQDRVYTPISSGELTMGAAPEYECCTSHGGVVALDLESGAKIWTYHAMEEATPRRKSRVGTQLWGPSGAPIWTTPAIDEKRGVLYVGTGQNTSEPATNTSDAVLAIDLKDGTLRWSFQATENDIFLLGCLFEPDGPNCPPDYSINKDWDFGASMLIADQPDGSDIILAGQKSGELWALDPDRDGKLLWRADVGPGGPAGGIHWGMAYEGRRVFVAVNKVGIPGEDADEPGLHAIDAATGKVLWSFINQADCSGDRKQRITTCDRNYGLSAATLLVDGAVIQGGNDGYIRIFDGDTGELLFSYDTAREYQGVNGVTGHGGSIDNTTIVAAHGKLYVQSGYGQGGAPGNVLLAFSPRR